MYNYITKSGIGNEKHIRKPRRVPMKVLVLGLSRTGTDSIRKALIHLGYNDTYHGYTAAAERPQDCQLWLEALEAKFEKTRKPYDREDWDHLLGTCQAVCDIPAVCFAEDLLHAYPNAKVILSNRNVDAWHESVKEALLKNVFTPWAAFVDMLAWLTRSPHRFTRPMFIKAFKCYFGDFEQNGKSVFEEHYAMVRRLCRGEHLEYDVRDGWEPLCLFLGEEVPQIPFPNGNTKAETTQRIRAIVDVEVKRLVEVAVRGLVFAIIMSMLI